MLSVQIPKDLNEIKTKTIGKFTKRQAIYFAIGLAIGFLSYTLLCNPLGIQGAVFGTFFSAMPFFMFSMYSRGGKTAEQIIMLKIRAKLYPKIRPFEQKAKRGSLESAPPSFFTKVKHFAYNKAFGAPVPPQTAQDTIPYIKMYANGICKVTEEHYTKTIAFEDISFTLAGTDDKQHIFGDWCQFINFFDESITLQFTYFNYKADLKELEREIAIRYRNDSFKDIRKEFYDMLKMRLIKGNKGMIKRKYITYGIRAKSPKEAHGKIMRLENDILKLLSDIGCVAYSLDGRERLRVIHKTFHQSPGKKCPLEIHPELKAENINNINTKDFISPSNFDFTDTDTFSCSNGKTKAAVSLLKIQAPQLPPSILRDFLDTDYPIMVNMHCNVWDRSKSLKYAKGKQSDINKMKVDEQKKANQEGIDSEDSMAADIPAFSREAKWILEELQSSQEKYFPATVLIMNFGRNQQELENRIATTKGTAQKYSCEIRRLDLEQEQGLRSSLPLGFDEINAKRMLTTSAAAVFMPFHTKELLQKDPKAIYYGYNALTKIPILANRRMLDNPNGVVLGVPGVGKSFLIKREATNVFLVTADDLVFYDPESEYSSLVYKLGGVVIKLSESSTSYINPMDIVLDYGTQKEPNDPIALKSEFVLAMFEIITTRVNGLGDQEKSVIDRCVEKLYEPYISNPIPQNMPILSDLRSLLLNFKDLLNENEIGNENDEELVRVSRRLADALYLYTEGSLKVFNNRTNIDINNRVVCFDAKGLRPTLQPLAMLLMQDQIWGRVSHNRKIGRGTWVYKDEFHLLMRSKQTAAYSAEMFKRFRKWGATPTVITQNVKEFLNSSEVSNILDNCKFIAMLNQAPGDRAILADQYNISPEYQKYITKSKAGCGLLLYGAELLAFEDDFPKGQLYDLMTTRPDEVAEVTKANKETNKIKKIV